MIGAGTNDVKPEEEVPKDDDEEEVHEGASGRVRGKSSSDVREVATGGASNS
jgi:hypothetical protein